MGKDFSQFNRAVNTYSKLYNAYIKNTCPSNVSSTDQFSIDLTNTDFTNNPVSSVTTSCSVLNGKLRDFGNNISTCAKRYKDNIKNDIRPYNGLKNEVESTYTEVKSKRSKLDQDVLKILGTDNSPLYEKQGIIDSAIYTTLLWTVLATSGLYYVFTKI
jgi:hypothetical protein